MVAQSHFAARDGNGVAVEAKLASNGTLPGIEAILGSLLTFVDGHLGDRTLAAIGHRVVHDGPGHVAPERVTPAGLEALEALTPLDPRRRPHNFTPMRALFAVRPEVPQVACFDTVFHHTTPSEAQHFGLPHALSEAGVLRYGVPGLSYEYVGLRLKVDAPELAKGRVIVSHLGAGASLCPLRKGVSIETTMGFSVLDGLLMATRRGAVDPGAILYLARQ